MFVLQAKVTGSRSSQDIDEAFREAQVAEDGEDVSPGVASTTDPVEEKVPLWGVGPVEAWEMIL